MGCPGPRWRGCGSLVVLRAAVRVLSYVPRLRGIRRGGLLLAFPFSVICHHPTLPPVRPPPLPASSSPHGDNKPDASCRQAEPPPPTTNHRLRSERQCRTWGKRLIPFPHLRAVGPHATSSYLRLGGASRSTDPSTGCGPSARRAH
ncbi:hypothetical protein GQ53DRAFT_377959 [Thozetella sp. PMI_491]|nr:hypothetical protein GQ53DRAFT_377959 [Thozetella sp. PMI_491]